MRIAVVGAGAVGCYLGARLLRAGHQVTLLERGEQLHALQAAGLTLRSPFGDERNLRVPASDDPHGVGPVDAVLLSVRSYDLLTALDTVQLLIDDGTAVLPLQNHVEAADDVAAAIGEERVAGAFVELDAVTASPGVVVQSGPLARLTFGELSGEKSRRLQLLQEALTEAGVDTRLSDDIRTDLWRNWAFNCAFEGLTALSRQPLGTVVANESLLSVFTQVLAECVQLARSRSRLLEGGHIGRLLDHLRSLPGELRSTMARDLAAGRPLELEALNGLAVRRGAAHGLAMTANQVVHAGLSPFEGGVD